MEWSWDFVVNVLYHAILPAFSIILASVGFWMLGMRGMMVTNMGEDYMLLADAKGLKSTRIFFRYAMRNAMLPQFTGLALNFGQIVSGAVLVEVIFSWPGLGRLLVQAILTRDYPLLQGTIIILTVVYAGANLVVDIMYTLIDPRIRYD